MSYPAKILFKSFVKPFYKENAGIFIFFFTVMFGIIGKVDGAGLFEYHYSLITGMLKNGWFLLLVFFLWFLYVRKCFAFISNVLENPHYAFIYVFNCLRKAKQFRLFFAVEVWLLMPVLVYSFFIVFIGVQQHFYLTVLFILVYLLLLCVAPALLHIYQLNNSYKKQRFSWKKVRKFSLVPPSYCLILMQFVANKQKTIWVGVKVFTCGILYLTARNNTLTDSDTGFAFLFFNFGILANAVIIFRIREFEETYLSFYRQIPVLLIKRFVQYALFCLIFLIPEYITICMLLPVHLNCADAIGFALCACSLLLLMISLTFLHNFSMKEYITVLFLIFCVQLIFLLIFGLTLLYLLFFISSIVIFFKGYYNFEQSI